MSWTDRVVEYPNRVKLTAVSGQDNTFNMEAAEGTVYVEGTLLNAENLNNETMNLIGNVISDAWNDSRSYSVGDSCIYNNMLWNCLVANTNMAPTEGTYWTRVKLANTDYVVERGTDGNWMYEKWASGKYEAWCRVYTYYAITAASGGGFYQTSWITINFPSGFTGINYVGATVELGAGTVTATIGSVSESRFTYSANRYGSISANGYTMAHVIGRWK